VCLQVLLSLTLLLLPPRISVTSANAPDVNLVTPTTRPRLAVIVDYVESPSNSAQSTNAQSSDVDFIYPAFPYHSVYQFQPREYQRHQKRDDHGGFPSPAFWPF
jgi:hypothetical protein